MAYDRERRGGRAGGGHGGAQERPGAIGKQTLVEQAYGGHAYGEHDEDLDDAPRESGGGGPLKPVRFSDDDELAAAAEGKKTFKAGASGLHVTKVQRALAELGRAGRRQGRAQGRTGERDARRHHALDRRPEPSARRSP